MNQRFGSCVMSNPTKSHGMN